MATVFFDSGFLPSFGYQERAQIVDRNDRREQGLAELPRMAKLEEGSEKNQKYAGKGFVVLGFPANEFRGQEPGTNEEIKQFCTLTYEVGFPLFAKADVILLVGAIQRGLGSRWAMAGLVLGEFRRMAKRLPTSALAERGIAAPWELPADGKMPDGAVIIAAITSCTNTSNPDVLIAAGLVAKKANERGLKPKPWVKTSLAPGSQVVTDYLIKAGLQEHLDAIGFDCKVLSPQEEARLAGAV